MVLTLCMLAISATHNVARPDLWLGDRSMKPAQIELKAKAYGKVKRGSMTPFSGLVLKPGVSKVKASAALKELGVDFVLPGDADRVDITSEPSVRRHVEYIKARHELTQKGGRREIEEREEREKSGIEEEEGGDFYESLAYYLQMRVGPSGKIDRNMYQDGAKHRDQMPPSEWGDIGIESVGGVFKSIGPKNTSTPYNQYMSAGPISGRKNGVAYAKSNPSIIYVASAGGGVWKSTNGGSSFSALSDKWPFLNTNCVIVHPTNPNIVLVGTGDYYGHFSTNSFGVMRSTDGGVNWTNVGDSGMRSDVVSRMAYDPTNANIIVATCGKSGSDNSVIHRSTDGGITWTALNTPTGNWDDLDVSTGGVFYATGSLPGTSGGVYKSTDHGATWNPVANPAVNEQRSLDIACSKVSASIVYLLVPDDQKVYKSTTSGASWNEVTGNFPNGTGQDPNYNWSQSSYDYHISCGKDGTSDLVFVGLITVAMSRNGNGTWVDIGRSFADTTPNNIHSDQHGFAMNPTNTNVVLFACDGGLFRLTVTPGGTTGTWAQLNSSFQDLQFYELAVSSSGDGWLQGGCQDNFSPSCRNDYASWKGIGAGDGCWAGYGPNGQNFVTNQFGGCFLYTSLTDTTGDYIKPQDQAFESGFFSPFVYAQNPGKIYAGAGTLWRYNNNNTWTNFGHDITPYQPQPGEPVNTVNELETAKNDKSIVYSGSSNGEVFRISANGTAYKQIDNTSIDRPVGAIDTAWANANDVLVGLMGDRNGNPRLWRCTNTQATNPVWTNAGGSGITGLPDVPINGIERDPYDANRWYVATDVGAFMSTNAGSTWTNMTALGLPNVNAMEIVVNPAKTSLFIGTFGRGAWKAPLATQPTPFQVSGTVKLGNGTAVSGATIKLLKKKTASFSVNTSPNATIPDWDYNGIYFPINITQNITVTDVNVHVKVTHQIPNDLEIWLISPANVATLLFSSQLPLPPNLDQNFHTGYFNGTKSQGQWNLFVRDIGPLVEGTLDKFDLSISYEGYLTLGSKLTSATGAYSFTGLEAGMYQIIPSMTGKTFSPTNKFFDLGPNATVNFTRSN